MTEETATSPGPKGSATKEVAVARIRQARDTIVSDHVAILDRVLSHLETKLAAANHEAAGQAGDTEASTNPLTDHEKDVFELCQSSRAVLAAESLSGQLRSKRLEKIKLSRDQTVLWQKMIAYHRPYLAEFDDETPGDGNEAEDEEYRVEKDPSPMAHVEPTLNSIAMTADYSSPAPAVGGSSTATASASRKRSLSLSKTDLRDLVPKRAKPEPRPRFKHITNALREEIVRDHISSQRGQAATVIFWKERYPELTITQSSLSRWIKNAENIQIANSPTGYASNRSHAKIRVNYPQIDEDTATALLHVQDESEVEEPITHEMIRQKFCDICDERNVPIDNRPKFSNGWMESFKRRHVLLSFAPGPGGRKRRSRRSPGEDGDSLDVDEEEGPGGHDHNQLVGQALAADSATNPYLSSVNPTLGQEGNHDIGFMAVSAAVNAAGSSSSDHPGQITQLVDLAEGPQFDPIREGESQDGRRVDRRRAGPSRLHELRYGADSPQTPTSQGENVNGSEDHEHDHTDEADAQLLMREVYERDEAERRGQGQHPGTEMDVETDEHYQVDPSLDGAGADLQ